MDDWRELIDLLIKQEDEAWTSSDPAGFGRLLTDDCVCTDLYGNLLLGRASFVERHESLFRGMFRASSLDQDVELARLIHPTVATVETNAAIRRQHRPDVFALRLTQVLVFESGNWKVASLHSVTDPLGSVRLSVAEIGSFH
jgi:uncharacterized protein (TIGR02246 family)